MQCTRCIKLHGVNTEQNIAQKIKTSSPIIPKIEPMITRMDIFRQTPMMIMRVPKPNKIIDTISMKAQKLKPPLVGGRTVLMLAVASDAGHPSGTVILTVAVKGPVLV